MSWFKKINKLFISNSQQEHTYETEYDEINEYEDEASQKQEKKKFVFPKIEDFTEPTEKQANIDRQDAASTQRNKEAKSLYNDGGQSQVYDVEVSGIKQLLEQRKNGVKTPPRSRTQSASQPKANQLAPTKLPTRKTEKVVEKPIVQEVKNKKKFVPTNVPSPVYGFNLPNKREQAIIHSGKTFEEIQKELNDSREQKKGQLEASDTNTLNAKPVKTFEEIQKELREARQLKHEQKLAEQQKLKEEAVHEPVLATDDTVTAKEQIETQAEPLAPTEELEVEQAIVEVAPVQEEKMEEVEEKTEVVQQSSSASEQVTIPEPELPAAEVDTLQAENITFHNSTIHIEHVTIAEAPTEKVEQMIQSTVATLEKEAQPVESEMPKVDGQLVQENVETNQEAPAPQATTTKGSRLPFNVLMLKSDKEKLAAKQEKQQIIEQTLSQQLVPLSVETTTDAHRSVLASSIQSFSTQLEPIPQLEQQVEQASEVLQQEQQTLAVEEEDEFSQIDATYDLEDSFVQPFAEELVVIEEVEEVEVQQELVAEMQPELKEVMHEQDTLAQIDEEIKEQVVSEEVSEVEQLEEPQSILATEAIELENLAVVEEPNAVIEKEEVAEKKLVLEDPHLNEPLPYQLPPLEILAPAEEKQEDTEWMEEQGEHLVEALSHFQVQAQVESVVQGPAVTQFEITVGHGTKVSKVRNLSDDIQLALAARDIRIDAPIPGKRSIGIEIPNRVSRAVRLSEVTNSEQFKNSDSPLEAALGLDLNGNPVTLDLRKMPHGLIAGATGSGKSVCINSILVSLLYKSAPHELKLMLIDPKMVELAPFNHIPHLVSPVITDVKAATESLKWAVEEMERRYQLFMHSGTRDITRYNKLCEENEMYAQKLPYILIVIDELADLMMMSPADVELAISRLAQKARACGIHLILATQRPSVDVITGTLKSNIPTRVAFAVSSQIDSRTIIDQQGAERLLGRGDMLYLGNGMNAPQRIQGTYVTDEEIEEVVAFARSQGEPKYFFKSEELVQKSEVLEEQDELFEEVCRFVFAQGSASTSSIQRRYHIGYNRAARLVDLLESQGLISEQRGSKPREVYITEATLENMFS